jgi:hypothetical protein
MATDKVYARRRYEVCISVFVLLGICGMNSFIFSSQGIFASPDSTPCNRIRYAYAQLVVGSARKKNDGVSSSGYGASAISGL